MKGFVINSGFSNSGVLIQSNGNRLESSYVGTNAAGDTVAGSFGFGAVRIQGSNNVIGGASSAERNVIAASAGGLRVENAGSANNTIQGNYIGVNAAGTASLGATGLGIDSATGTPSSGT